MAKISDNKKISNEEIEATVEEFSRKLEILRVRYEQYFIGNEKVAPVVMRMDVARMMRELELVKIKNTALKFKLRTAIQKFTSYSTYWNRTLREIEEGTYKRHIDRAKREQAQKAAPARQAVKRESSAAKTQASQDAAAEAEAFLASMGLGSAKPSPQTENKPASQNTPMSGPSHPAIHRPAIQPAANQTPASKAQAASQSELKPQPSTQIELKPQAAPQIGLKPQPAPQTPQTNQNVLRQRRPAIIRSAAPNPVAAPQTPAVQLASPVSPATPPQTVKTASGLPKLPPPIPRLSTDKSHQ